MKKFRNIYIEITNICNLSCSFCPKTKRRAKSMTTHEFSQVLDKVLVHTEFIYLHVVGEPLLHPELDGILTCCDEKNAKVKLTTNGTLLKKNLNILTCHPSLKAVNISLSCLKDFDAATALGYLDDVFFAAEFLRLSHIKTVLRAWTDIKYLDIIGQRILEKYNAGISFDIVGVQKICDHLLFDTETEFVWPINSIASATTAKSCLGLRKQLAILSCGTVVPCCLDSEGILELGNIFEQELEEILCSQKATKISRGFSSSQAVEPFCQTCTFSKM